MNLHQIVYYSRNTVGGDTRTMLQSLRDIVSVSQKNNARDDITGALIFDKTWFLQVLEGDATAITRTYDRIAKDSRHGEVTLMKKGPISERRFADWSMGGTMRSPEMQEIFLNHGIAGAVDPTKLNAATVVALAQDLKAFEAERKSGVS
ncbi:BLUF domain-containing protein [Caenispirillum salinarum]|uniref:BLUF domain-containing protein n=1 Tax=Caenispirillum salinarum TaxID=859058 RepID=UPI00384D91DD